MNTFHLFVFAINNYQYILSKSKTLLYFKPRTKIFLLSRHNCNKLNVIHNYDNIIKYIIINRSVNIFNSLNNNII